MRDSRSLAIERHVRPPGALLGFGADEAVRRLLAAVAAAEIASTFDPARR